MLSKDADHLRNLDDHDAAKFAAKVGQRGPDECWEWQAFVCPRGYGRFSAGRGRARRIVLAHRVAFVLGHGVVPADPAVQVCHRCDNRRCCNPAHLFLGTPKDNMDDMTAKGRDVRLPGERNGNARLSEAQVRDIRARVAAGEKHRDIAKAVGVSKSLVTNVTSGPGWRQVS